MGEEEVDLTHSILYRIFCKRCHDDLFHIKDTNDVNENLVIMVAAKDALWRQQIA